MDLLNEEIFTYLDIDQHGFVIEKSTRSQPHGLVLADVLAPKDDPHPFVAFKVDKGKRTLGAACWHCANVQNEFECNCSDRESSILIHTTLPELNHAVSILSFHSSKASFNFHITVLKVSRGYKIMKLREVKYYKESDFIFRPIIMAYQSFLKKSSSKFMKKLLKRLMVTSFGMQLVKPVEFEQHFCKSEVEFRKALSGFFGDVVSTSILNEKLIQVTTTKSTSNSKPDLHHNIVLGMYLQLVHFGT